MIYFARPIVCCAPLRSAAASKSSFGQLFSTTSAFGKIAIPDKIQAATGAADKAESKEVESATHTNKVDVVPADATLSELEAANHKDYRYENCFWECADTAPFPSPFPGSLSVDNLDCAVAEKPQPCYLPPGTYPIHDDPAAPSMHPNEKDKHSHC